MLNNSHIVDEEEITKAKQNNFNSETTRTKKTSCHYRSPKPFFGFSFPHHQNHRPSIERKRSDGEGNFISHQQIIIATKLLQAQSVSVLWWQLLIYSVGYKHYTKHSRVLPKSDQLIHSRRKDE
jgi:hypothetical protein